MIHIEKHSRQRMIVLLRTNADAIRVHNAAFLYHFLLIGFALAIFASCCGSARADMFHALPAYLSCAAGFALLLCIFRGQWGRQHPLLGLYFLVT